MATHALLETGTGGTTAAAKTQIGSDITLPAGGPWTIFDVWSIAVKSTTVPNEGTGGQLIVEAKSGDLSPDPAPGKYPLFGSCASESANSAISEVATSHFPVNWQASGKAVLSLYYQNQLAITTGSPVAAGIIFGNEIPDNRPLVFSDGVYNSWAATAETLVGTITLAEKATRIVGICADLRKGDAPTAGEAILGTIRLASDDVKMPPAQYPCVRGYNASDGTAVGQSSAGKFDYIPVDIPVEGGARIAVYGTTTISVTGNADMHAFIAYE